MLGKLLKYEVMATARIFLPLYAVLLAYSVIQRIITALSPDKVLHAPQAISTFLYVMIVIATFVVTFVMVIQRFYKNLLTDEGYLMFTLPTLPWMHTVSKLLVAMMWTVVSVVAAGVSVIIISLDNGLFSGVSGESLMSAAHEFLQYFKPSTALFGIEFLIAGIIGLAASILIIYASISLGQLFNKHKIFASLGAFIVLNTVSQIIVTIISVIPGMALFGTNKISIVDGYNPSMPGLHLLMWFIIIIGGLFDAGYFVITNQILRKRLNLE